jgi:hypothetical protein
MSGSARFYQFPPTLPSTTPVCRTIRHSLSATVSSTRRPSNNIRRSTFLLRTRSVTDALSQGLLPLFHTPGVSFLPFLYVLSKFNSMQSGTVMTSCDSSAPASRITKTFTLVSWQPTRKFQAGGMQRPVSSLSCWQSSPSKPILLRYAPYLLNLACR